MADSDNTTTLPIVIKRWRGKQRRVRAIQAQSSTAGPLAASIVSDPATVLLSDWNETHHASSVLCRLQQRQESHLLRLQTQSGSFGVPHSQSGDLQAARAAELAAIDEEDRLLAACAAVSATTLAGVLAKLEMIETAGESRGAANEFPWPQIRSVTANLKKLLSSRQEVAVTA